MAQRHPAHILARTDRARTDHAGGDRTGGNHAWSTGAATARVLAMLTPLALLAAPPPAQAAPPRKPAPPAVAAASTAPNTLTGALTATYRTQPALLAERAKLRATDEDLPQALSGWRPSVVIANSAGYGDGMSRAYNGALGAYQNIQTDRLIGTAQATVTQPIYSGGKVQANVNKAKNSVMAERATLIEQEEQSFTDTVNAYVGVIEAKDVLALNVNNEQVLSRQLDATNDRFRVGEITRTDVAQAQAALSAATAERQTAEGQLQTARATFQKVIGYAPPADLVEPQPLALPVQNETTTAQMASRNNPQVIVALFNDAAAKDAVDVAFSQLLPQLSLQGQIFQQNNASSRSDNLNGYEVVANLSVPLYQGGAEYSAVRQARQSEQQTHRLIDDARRTAVQTAVAAWQTLVAARASAASTRSAISANQIALEGVEREAIVGSRTTQDVLNAQQSLLSSEVTLVQNVAQVVTGSYLVAAAIGRLTARDLRLPVAYYNDTAYYNAVKNRWFGLGDYATDQPNR